METEGYSFDSLEIDGMQVSYYSRSDKEKYFFMSNYSQGTHILTVYYYQSDNSSFKFSKTITIEIE